MIRGITTIARFTFHEALRRKILLAVLVCGAAFVTLFGVGIHFIGRDLAKHGAPFVEQRAVLTMITLAGLYAVNFLLVMTAVLLPVDTLSGEIASGVMQTLAAKPVRRSEILLGKWIAHVILIAATLALLAGGTLAVARLIAHVTPPNLLIGLPLMLLEGTVLVTLSILGGTRLGTVTNGVVVFGLYGLAFLGNWVEQIGTFTGNDAARYVGTVASLIMPTEAMWQLGAHHMHPSVLRGLGATPFSPASVPSPAMVVWAAAYAIIALAFAVRRFARREL